MSDDTPLVTIQPGRESAIYNAGEQVEFHVTVADGVARALGYSLTWDGAELIRRGTVTLTDNRANIVVSPNRPGIVRLTIESDPLAELAVVVSPEEIAPSLPAPDDFDSVWRERTAAEQNAPESFGMSPHAETDTVITYAVTIPASDAGAIYGWLHVPRGNGPFPAVVRYHGAGVYLLPAENGADWAERGVMAFSINPQSVSNDMPREFYDDLRQGDLADYRDHPEAFVKMFRRAILATSFVASLPQWDGTRLIAEGHSQGGGQALASAAFSSHVDALVVSCPTHCDHTAKPAGWPKILQEEDEADRVREVQYIDGVNFAARVSCPALFGICFLDTLCPPTGVFAAYNALQASKSAHHDPVTGHVYTDAFQDLTYRWVGKLLAATGNR